MGKGDDWASLGHFAVVRSPERRRAVSKILLRSPCGSSSGSVTSRSLTAAALSSGVIRSSSFGPTGLFCSEPLMLFTLTRRSDSQRCPGFELRAVSPATPFNDSRLLPGSSLVGAGFAWCDASQGCGDGSNGGVQLPAASSLLCGAAPGPLSSGCPTCDAALTTLAAS